MERDILGGDGFGVGAIQTFIGNCIKFSMVFEDFQSWKILMSEGALERNGELDLEALLDVAKDLVKNDLLD